MASNGSDYASYGVNSNANYYQSYSQGADRPPAADAVLRRRTAPATPYGGDKPFPAPSSASKVVKNLDFMFPKVESEFTVQSERGGLASAVAIVLIAVLALAELLTWAGQNSATTEHISVDTALGKRMRVNLNITFPALACEDLHVDAMDVAGDSQIDVEDTLIKKMLRVDGTIYSAEEIEVDMNSHREEQEEKEAIIKKDLPENYCGPCYGGQGHEAQCCQTCDEVIAAYKERKWKTDLLKYTSEQCIREGRDKKEPKRMTNGQGCNLSGFMTVNRVAGNFHIAMGEGIERDGRHIHTFVPEDAPNFNSSHVIHQLSFGPGDENTAPLNGVTKFVGKEHGTTGLFQYFIKVVPTTYIGENLIPATAKEAMNLPSLYPEIEDNEEPDVLETNRYSFTERFRPLMKEYIEDEHIEKDDPKKAGVDAGATGGHHHADHHKVQNAVLPGVFFIYEIYPFAVEITRNHVPFTHFLIRLMATVGGVFTVVGWADSAISGSSGRRRSLHTYQ
jgi:endoplasmic reticulum-Golgi intermediate compartment protein 3